MKTLTTMLMLTVFAGPSIAASIIADPTKPWPDEHFVAPTEPWWDGGQSIKSIKPCKPQTDRPPTRASYPPGTKPWWDGGQWIAPLPEEPKQTYKRTDYPIGLDLEMEETDHCTIANLTFKELPPVAYDHPVKGPVVVTDYENEAALRAACNIAPPAGYLVGCARAGNPCLILLGPVSPAFHGLTRNIVLRHEMAHCNGWPGDHPGMR
jgi:hypothetical protein